MTLKRELQYLEQNRAISPDLFSRQLAVAFRSCPTDAKVKKIAKHFNIPLQDVDTIIKQSYR